MCDQTLEESVQIKVIEDLARLPVEVDALQFDLHSCCGYWSAFAPWYDHLTITTKYE